MAYDNTIQSGRSALVRYEFRFRAMRKGPLTVTAAVNYRHLRQSYLNNVLGRIIRPIRWSRLLRERAAINSWEKSSLCQLEAARQSGLDALEQSGDWPIWISCSMRTRSTPLNRS